MGSNGVQGKIMLTGSDVVLEDFKFHKYTPSPRDFCMCCNMSHFQKGVEERNLSLSF